MASAASDANPLFLLKKKMCFEVTYFEVMDPKRGLNGIFKR